MILDPKMMVNRSVDNVLDGDPALSPKGAEPPNFRPMSIMAKRLHGSRCHLIVDMDVGVGTDDVVLDGTQLPLTKNGAEPPPQFSAHVYCGQIAGWIKMALGVEVCLRRGHIVLDGDPAPLPTKKGKSPSIFGPFLLWPKGWMHQNATWYGRRPKPRRHCVRWGPSCPSPKRGRSPPPLFSALVYCGQTA